MGDTNTGFGDSRATDSVVEPSSPVENCSFTPRWPITTRSATRAWSQISLATMPVASVVSQGTPRSAQRLLNVSSSTRPRSRSASRILAEKSRYGSKPSEPEMSCRKEPSIETTSMTCRPRTVARTRSASQRAYCRAASACSEPSSATRIVLIMAGRPWPPLTPARARVQGRPLQTAGGPLRGEAAMSRRDEALCEELKEVARRLGMQVREEVLLRDVGYRVRSGACRVRGDDVVFLDRNLPADERVQVLVDALAGRDLEAVYLTPAARRLLERRARAPSGTTSRACSSAPRGTSPSRSSTRRSRR